MMPSFSSLRLVPSESPLLDAPAYAAKASPAVSPARPAKAGLTLHLIGSAHLDPVWLWDWREGMNEGVATCRAMADLLEEYPEFRFIRGEAAIYAHVERHAPALFERIRGLVAEGRWDVVGGNWIQPDTNLPCTEALLRQFVRGKGYFREKFGREVTAAWAADSFGHAAGLPDILAAAGMESFAFTRPQAGVLPLGSQAFWWEGAGGARILSYRPHDGWYASERAAIGERLDACAAHAGRESLSTVAMFYGLGNHGGGPSRAHLREIRGWAERNPHVRVEHSGLHRFFAALREELAWRGEDAIPTRRGELNFCLRGCAASVARFKYAYRRAEAALLRSERTVAACAAVSGAAPAPEAATLADAWDGLLFNAFHDILPGSAIERAFDDQLAQAGAVSASAQRAETAALTDLAARIDTTAGAWEVPEDHPKPQPVLVWNPHPWALRTQVELEVSLDYRPLWQYQGRHHEAPITVVEAAGGRRLPHQVIAEEHDSLRELLWRRRVVVPVELPPLGWSLLQMGLDPLGVVAPACACAGVREPARAGEAVIENGFLSVAAKIGAPAATFTKGGLAWMPEGLQARLYEDPWGAWGGMNEERESWLLTEERERFAITRAEVLERGPERAALWVRLAGARSRVEITFLLGRDARHVELRVRAFLDDRGARLKLVLPAGGAAEYAVPGGTARREPCGEVPGGRWARAGAEGRAVGFASDALYGFDTTAEEFRATIARASRYASDVKRAPDEQPWQACADLGEHVFRALITPDLAELPRLADALEEPPVTLTVPADEPVAGAGLDSSGSLLCLEQHGPRLLALSSGGAGRTLTLRLQNTSASPLPAASLGVLWRGRELALPRRGPLGPGAIATWRLTPGAVGAPPLAAPSSVHS